MRLFEAIIDNKTHLYKYEPEKKDEIDREVPAVECSIGFFTDITNAFFKTPSTERFILMSLFFRQVLRK